MPAGVAMAGQSVLRMDQRGVTKVIVGPTASGVTAVSGAAVPQATNTGGSQGWALKDTRLLQMEYNFRGDFQIKGQPLLLDAEHPTATGETGLRVWDAGVVLAKALEYKLQDWCPDKPHPVIIDLGCGSGISSIAGAMVGANVVATDRDVLRERTSKNIRNNLEAIAQSGGKCEFQELDWNTLPEGLDRMPTADLIMASDVIWDKSFVEPFLRVALMMLRDPQTQLVMAHKQRSPELDADFFEAAKTAGLDLKLAMPSSEATPETAFHHNLVSVFIMQRRQ
jgi:predicted nicotinamide N-methyase